LRRCFFSFYNKDPRNLSDKNVLVVNSASRPNLTISPGMVKGEDGSFAARKLAGSPGMNFAMQGDKSVDPLR
jgi:hypothetical protein